MYTQNDTIQDIKYVKRDVGSEVRNMAEYKMLMDCDDGEVLFVTKTIEEFIEVMNEELSIGQIEDAVMDIYAWIHYKLDVMSLYDATVEGVMDGWGAFIRYGLECMGEWSIHEDLVSVAGNIEVDERD